MNLLTIHPSLLGRMRKLVQTCLLPFTVFITGGCVLVVEIVALRILAPYFGNTIYSVSSVLSVVLAALSCGYWFGGRLADRRPSKKLFFGIVMFSGLAVLCIQILQGGLLQAWGYDLPLASGPLIMSFLLFFLPGFVLGMLSPFAIALQQREAKDQGVGTTTGQMFFFSTFGSIVGSLLTGFVLIPKLGVTAIMFGVGFVLITLGLVPLLLMGIKKKGLWPIALLVVVVFALGTSSSPFPRVVYANDGLYERVMIFDGKYKNQPTRFLMLDSSNSAAMFKNSSDLVFDYSRYFAFYKLFNSNAENVLVMGGGGYSVPKAFLSDLPKAQIDVSEIEPTLPQLAKQYFALPDDPRLHHYIQDGRRMLHDTPNKYDVIFSDVYHSMYSIPSLLR